MEVIIVDLHRPSPSEVASFGSMDSVSETIVAVVMAKHELASTRSINCGPHKGSPDLDVIILYKKEIRLALMCRMSPGNKALWPVTAIRNIERTSTIRTYHNVVVGYPVHRVDWRDNRRKVNHRS
jgi:hypothetical protein